MASKRLGGRGSHCNGESFTTCSLSYLSLWYPARAGNLPAIEAVGPTNKRTDKIIISNMVYIHGQRRFTSMDTLVHLHGQHWSTSMDILGPLELHGQHQSNRLDIMIPLTKYACTSEQCADYDKSDDNSYIICRMISHASTSHTYSSRDHHVGLILPSGRTAVALWSSAPTQPGLELLRIRPLVGHTTRL